MSVFDSAGVAKGWAASVDAACRMLREAQTGKRGDGGIVPMKPLADLLGASASSVYNWKKGVTVCQDELRRGAIRDLAAQWRAIVAAREEASRVIAAAAELREVGT